MSAWLQRQRKSALVTLAESLGLDTEGMKKASIESALDEHLRVNRARLIHFPATSQYYSLSAPAKKEPVDSFLPESAKKTRTRGRPSFVPVEAQREVTSSGSESVEPADLTAQPPRSPSIYESSMPASPKVIADSIEENTAILREHLSNLWDSSVTDTVHFIRDHLSTTLRVEVIVLFFETTGLLLKLVPFKHAFAIRDFSAAGYNIPVLPVSLPDLFFLLTSSFWSPFGLWILTGILGPSLFSYFFNLTLRPKTGPNSRSKAGAQHNFDPLMFNIAKAVIVWLTYSDNNNAKAIFGDFNVHFVTTSIPGGYHGMLVGAFIGILTSIYGAVLEK